MQTLTTFTLTLGETYAILIHRAVNSKKQYQFAEKKLRTYLPCDLSPFAGTCQTDVVELTAEQRMSKPDKGAFIFPPQTNRASIASAGPVLTTNERILRGWLQTYYTKPIPKHKNEAAFCHPCTGYGWPWLSFVTPGGWKESR